jgi:hypothetical protein
MTGHGIKVDTGALRRHASSVDDVAGAVRTAQNAARHVRLGGAAYGQLCQALPVMLEPLHDLADRVIAEALSSLDETAYALRAVARSYDAVDEAAGRRIGRSG